jgi:predicted phage terminase large subunit-like protein
MPHVRPVEIDAPLEKIALLAKLREEARKRTDPHLAWLRTARPDQVLPQGDWRILYYQGGRGSGKTRSGTQGLAQLIREHEGDPADWGIIAPTFQAAWTTCVEGPSGILAALGTSMAEVSEHKSATVKSAYRTYGEIALHSGHTIRVDSANDGALRVQGKNLAGAYCIAAGEMISTDRGLVPVEEIVPGNVVKTRHGTRGVTAAGLTRQAAPVLRITVPRAFSPVAGYQSPYALRCTSNHHIWACERGWVDAGALKPGDFVMGEDPRKPCAVLSVEPDGVADVYDLTVADEPEFFAGGILVHNCSEIGLWSKWSVAWDESIAYAVRLGASKIIACGTPKISRPAAKLIRRLLSGEPGVIVRRLRTVDNLANLSGAFYEAIVARASGTRLERQELEGELLDDVENALWTRDLLHAIQVDAIPGADDEHTGLNTVYVGLDPSDGGEESDECAYTVTGQGEDYKLYVAEQWGGRIGPTPFLKKAVLAAAKWHGTLVVEKNHGGAYLIETLRQVMRDLGVYVPYMTVHASLGKRTRAEPVAAMYERGVVRHVNGPHVDLEDQMATFVGAARDRSPDRLDSLTWSCTPFLNYDLGFPDPYKLGAKRWAQSRELDAMAGSQTLFRRKIIAGQYGERASRQPGAWDLDTFAPQDDVGQGNRPNVKSWS